jgi:hypothetical protein
MLTDKKNCPWTTLFNIVHNQLPLSVKSTRPFIFSVFTIYYLNKKWFKPIIERPYIFCF